MRETHHSTGEFIVSTRMLNRQTKARIIAIPLALIIAGVWYYTSRGNTTGPEHKDTTSAAVADVGDCMQNKGSESAPDLSIVDCGASTADYKVKERYALDHTCDDGDSQYQATRRGRAQFTLCMEKLGQ